MLINNLLFLDDTIHGFKKVPLTYVRAWPNRQEVCARCLIHSRNAPYGKRWIRLIEGGIYEYKDGEMPMHYPAPSINKFNNF